jgi:hypothetical protein
MPFIATATGWEWRSFGLRMPPRNKEEIFVSARSDARELQRLLDDLRNAGYRQYRAQLLYVYEALNRTPRFRAVFDLLAAETSNFAVDDWVNTRVFAANPTCHEWPASNKHKLRALHRILEWAATEDKIQPAAVGRIFELSNNLDEHARSFSRHVVSPLMAYLEASLNNGSDTLYRLERVRRQTEWFEQEKLYEAFLSDSAKGEALYDRRVREFLFADGIDYPFSQPASPSGKADVVSGLESDDPLVCEIKLFDGDRYGAPYLAQGVVQARRYARDYGKAAAHLVIFNLSDDHLHLPSDEPGAMPPRLQIDGVTIFMSVVQAKPVLSASKDRRPVREITRDQLVPSTSP